MTTKFHFRPDFWIDLAWSRPDSPRPVICSKCKGALSELPLMLWLNDGSDISICEACVEKWMAL